MRLACGGRCRMIPLKILTLMREILFDPIRKKHHYGRYRIVKRLISVLGSNVLDIGCGSTARCVAPGSFLRELGYGTGIDIVRQNIDFDFIIGDLRQIPIQNDKFGVVTVIEVIEHIEDPRLALKNIHRIIKDNGHLIISMPSNNIVFSVLWWIWEHTFGDEWKHKYLVTYNKREWLDIFCQDGLFHIEDTIDYWHIILIVKMRKLSL